MTDDVLGDGGAAGGGGRGQVDPSCVPTPCIAPCTGELLAASTVAFADVDIDAVSIGDGAVFVAGNGVFMVENAGFLTQTSHEGAARWTTTFERNVGSPMDLDPTGTGDVHLCRVWEWKPGSRGATVDRFDASGQLASTVPRGVYSICEIQARDDDLFVITSGAASSKDGANPLQVTAYGEGESVRWSEPLPAAGFAALRSSLSPDDDLAVGYRALGGSGVAPRITVFRDDGTVGWQVDLRSSNHSADLTEVAFAPSGELVAMGRLSGTWEIDFGGGALSGSDHHLFLARYASDGAFRWARTFPLPAWNRFDGYAMAVDMNGHAVIVGLTESSRDLVGNPLDGAEHGVVFVEKFDDCGSHLWSSVAGTVSDGRPRPFVGADAAGGIVAVTTNLSSTGNEVLFATLSP